jgi:hypothetical protein
MRTIVRNLTLGLGLLTASLTNAQDADMKNMLKFGGNAGIAVPSTNSSANLGVDLAYQHLVVPGFGLGIATGYNHFFGKEKDGLQNNDFGVVPVAALLRVYPQETGFYFGTDVGYGFITGDKKVASNAAVERPDGGLYLKPEIGWHNRHWNVALQYNKLFTGDKGTIGSQKHNISSIGLGVSYNLPLGE